MSPTVNTTAKVVPVLTVHVESIDGVNALVKDTRGRSHTISANVRRGNGPLPRVGEVWLIDRTLGQWTFAAVLTSVPPVITGDTGGNTAVRTLLTSLSATGAIVNQTTNTTPNFSSSGAFVFTQSTPATLWVVTHNLPFTPAVTVVDSAGTVVHGEIQYSSPGVIRLTFSAGFSGTAYLS